MAALPAADSIQPAPGRVPRVGPARLTAIDGLRGAVMILMALDHTRDFFSNAGFDPLDLAQTTPGLFLTRWITHFCAPAFIFLAGVSAFLWAQARGKSKGELSRFLLARGALLIVLELTVVHWAWSFNLDGNLFLAQVIWAIGWAMIFLAGLVFLPAWSSAAFAVMLIAGHNLLDDVRLGGALWTILHRPGAIALGGGRDLYVLYPLVPWIGVMALGYALGPLFLADAPRRRRRWALLGAALLVGFALLRLLNRYGDPRPWSPQADGLFTALSFLNVEKYPPSLSFLLLTLGAVFLSLALLDRPVGRLSGVLQVYGRAPLFFYVLHLYLLHGLAAGVGYLRSARVLFPPGYGFSLPWVYGITLLVAVAAYPLCKWFAALKKRRPEGWLRYL